MVLKYSIRLHVCTVTCDNIRPLNTVLLHRASARAESVTETDIAIFLKTETDTDVGIEKNRKKRKPTKKIPKKTKIRFLLMTIY